MARINIDGSGNISDNFTKSEIRNASTGTLRDISGDLPLLAELVRAYSGGRAVKVNSAIRNFVPAGGVKNSAHMRGNALDLSLDGQQLATLKYNMTKFLQSAVKEYAVLGGFGIYPWGVHVDVERENITRSWADPQTPGVSFSIRHWGEPPYLVPGASFLGEPDFDASGAESVDVEKEADDANFFQRVKNNFVLLAILVGGFILFTNGKK